MIRDVTAADFGIVSGLNTAVQELHAQALPALFKPPAGDGFPAAEVSGYLEQPGAFIAVHFDGDRPAGYVAARRSDRPEDGRRYALAVLYIDHIAVLPDCRGRGIGRALIDFVRDRARAEGIDHVALDVWSFNDSARDFFRACGFATYNERMWAEP